MAEQFVSVRGLLKALDANSTEGGRYQKLYDTIAKGPAPQRALAESLGISQAIISTMVRRLVTCGVLTTVKGTGAKNYAIVCPSKLDMQRLNNAHQVLDAQRKLETLRTVFKAQYGELP